MNWTRLTTMAKGIALSCLPEEEKRARIDAARDQRRVEFLPPQDGVMNVSAVLDAVDGRILEGQVNRLAGILATGSAGAAERPRRAWSAKALGVLANPARALHLLQESLLDQPAAAVDSTVSAHPVGARGDAGAPGSCHHGAPADACGRLVVDPDRLLPKVELLVHISDESLLTERGTARSPKLGAIAAGRLRDVLSGCRVSIRPVLKVDALPPQDAYEVPQAMRDAVIFRQPVEAFPWSKRTAKLDLDHTIPYQQGRSGQTSTANLTALGRRAHRAKTFGGWHTTQPVPGVSIWRSSPWLHLRGDPLRHVGTPRPRSARVVTPAPSRETAHRSTTHGPAHPTSTTAGRASGLPDASRPPPRDSTTHGAAHQTSTTAGRTSVLPDGRLLGGAARGRSRSACADARAGAPSPPG